MDNRKYRIMELVDDGKRWKRIAIGTLDKLKHIKLESDGYYKLQSKLKSGEWAKYELETIGGVQKFMKHYCNEC